MDRPGPARNSLSHRLAATIMAQPALFVSGLLLITLASLALVLVKFQIEGDIARALKGDSAAYEAFHRFEDEFGTPSQDEVYMVRAPDFGQGEALAAAEDLVAELAFSEAAAGVVSLFSLPDPDGTAPSFLTRPDLADLGDAERLDLALERVPTARQILSADRTTMLISVIPDPSIPAAERLNQFDAVLEAADPILSVTPIGLSALQRTIASGLTDDLLFLLPTIIGICLAVSLAVFRSWRAALICTIPAVLGLIWTFGAMVALGITFNAVLAVAPAVLIVLGIADSIHLFSAIIRWRDTKTLRTAVANGLHETLPAIAMATLTTIVAFASLRLVGSPTLADLALVGGLGLALALVAVVVTVPVASHFLLSDAARIRRPASFSLVSRLATGTLQVRRPVAVLAILLLLGLAAIQSNSVAGFLLTSHVPVRSEIRAALATLHDQLTGSDQLFVVVDLPDGGAQLTEADRTRVRLVSETLYGDPGAIPDNIAEQPRDNAMVRRVLGTERTAIALPVAVSLDDGWTDILHRADDLRASLDAAGLAEVSHVTGYSLMASVELPNLVRQLRLSFYITVGAVTLLAAILLRSIPLALMSLVPNLIPILGIEAALVVSGMPLTLTGAISLTIAFGIAVDDTIHLLNRLRLTRADLGHPTVSQVARAVTDIVPPVMVSSLILFAGLGMTAFSTLPSAALFGRLVIGALLLALLADLFLFPSLLAWRDKENETP